MMLSQLDSVVCIYFQVQNATILLVCSQCSVKRSSYLQKHEKKMHRKWKLMEISTFGNAYIAPSIREQSIPGMAANRSVTSLALSENWSRIPIFSCQKRSYEGSPGFGGSTEQSTAAYKGKMKSFVFFKYKVATIIIPITPYRRPLNIAACLRYKVRES
jgi:hypothetical protein